MMLPLVLSMPAVVLVTILIGSALGLAWVYESTPPPVRVWPFLARWFPLAIMPGLLALGWWIVA